MRSGVYFGWAALALAPDHPDHRPAAGTAPAPAFTVFPMVMSIGYNPFYKNSVRSAEVHVLHAFAADFYGVHMRVAVLAFVRDELDYKGLDALVADINLDCDVARRSLARPAWTPSAGLPAAASEPGTPGLRLSDPAAGRVGGALAGPPYMCT